MSTSLNRISFLPPAAQRSSRFAARGLGAARHIWADGRFALIVALSFSSCGRSPAGSLPRARAESGIEVYWPSDREIVLEPIVPLPSANISSNDLVTVLKEEAGAWNRALGRCGGPRLRVGELRAAGAAHDDGRNEVVVRSDTWCPPDTRMLSVCYDRSRQSITHLRAGADGRIREADIELNAVDFRWNASDGAGTTKLRAVFGHELGHVLGLEHSCGPSSARPTISDCRSPAAIASIMYPDPTEQGRSPVLEPGPDAIATLCAIAHAQKGALPDRD